MNVAVDLSISGARSSNYMRSVLFGGMSPVEFAVEQMQQAGVEIVGPVRLLFKILTQRHKDAKSRFGNLSVFVPLCEDYMGILEPTSQVEIVRGVRWE